ncbi:peptidoglycan bridge formation glycyltransferase FemA/FemB family protein [Psychromicrobium xiongbiense]|uniref:peptidoglycan bridge formation glycyltransferase FemA/FemB family protein n=1 Tax=Psychromicrobium xiongbiense TaxID=3051184 RepID=UPI00255342F9|nr:peptidoglycan bridge formation glycyltransferase FemA/FemB family protein [Psychromicrobium sp. YIM S02556]
MPVLSSEQQLSFVTLGDAEFDDFSRTHPLNNFIQSLDLALSQRNRRIPVELLGVRRGSELVAAGKVTLNCGRGGYTVAACQKGPLLDYADQELLEFFTTEATAYLAGRGVHELVISPYLPYVHRDADGVEHPEVEDNSSLIPRLAELGYRHHGFGMDFANINWMFVKDLEGIANADEMLMGVSYRTRKAVRKAEKNGVFIEEATEDTLQEFFDTIENAGDEKGFTNRPLDYYRELMTTTRPGFARMMMAKIDLEAFRRDTQAALEAERTVAQGLREEIAATGSKKKINRLKVVDEVVESYERALADTDSLRPERPVVTLAAIYFTRFGSEVVCVIGGSRAEYVYFNGATALYWHMLVEALEEGYRRYNFYGTFGIEGDDDAGHGGYEFKKGFGGTVVQLIGEFSLPVRPLAYRAFRVVKKLQKLARRNR